MRKQRETPSAAICLPRGDKASQIQPTVDGSPIYGAWVKYARAHPEKVFAPLVGEESR
jgi:hypothetical protein